MHPIPRQITTFEFKLIGFLTLKQFVYLAMFLTIALVFFYLIPIPLLNFFFAGIFGLLGVALAFVPVNERPLDLWIKNFVRKLFSPSQYYYFKINDPPDFLKNVFIFTNTQTIQSHLEAQKKLSSYLPKTPPSPEENNKQKINEFISSNQTTPSMLKKNGVKKENLPTTAKPFFLGTVKNGKNIPLSNILVYVKNKDQIVRILKTNSHGVFATFHSLPEDLYVFEVKDPKNKYFFDTMKMRVSSKNESLFNFVSRELI